MQRHYRFEIISVSREKNFLPCSTEWDKSVYFTPSNLLLKSVVKMKHLTREQRYGISLMLQEGKPVFTKEMKETVISLLEEGYSPEQIKGRSNVEGFAMVSHETIYR